MCRNALPLPMRSTGMTESAAEDADLVSGFAAGPDLIAVAHVNSVWLKGEGGRRANLAGHTFSHVVAPQLRLGKARFSACLLPNCELEGSSFEEAEIEHCDFSGSTLTDVDFTAAHFSDVDFARVWMPRACFVEAVLT